MYRLTYAALLSFAIVSLTGCGGGDATDESSSPTSVPSTGSSSTSTTKQAAAPTAAPSYDTPQAAFDALSKAAKNNDWKTATSLLTPESQSMMAAGMMLGASFMTMGDEAKQKDLEQLLKKHGVDMDEEPSDEDPEAGPEALTRNIKDLPTFVGEINEWMQKNGEGADSGFPEMGELGEVTIDGDTASATVDTEMGPQPIEFRRVDGNWLIHLPMDGPPPGDMELELEPIEDDGTPGLGTLMIGEKPFKLRQATAYKSKFFDDPCTVVLLTARPLTERQLSELKDTLKQEGNDDAFFPFVPHVKLALDESGELMSLFVWADNLSINSGSSDVVLDVEQSENRISGTAQIPEPTEALDTTYRFDATFDVELMSIEDE